jgi:hypothetical protein
MEVDYNEIFVGPMLRKVGINAPLNVTSLLQFGKGTKIIMGSRLNGNVNTIKHALPNLP